MAQGCAGCLVILLVLAVMGSVMAAAQLLAEGIAAALPLAIVCGSVVALVYIVMKAIQSNRGA